MSEQISHDSANVIVAVAKQKIQELESKLKAQQDLIDIMKEALEFYADIGNWETHEKSKRAYYKNIIGISDIELIRTSKTSELDSGGKIAREALAKLEKKNDH